MVPDVPFTRTAPLDAFAGKLAANACDAVTLQVVSGRSMVNLRGRATEEFGAAVKSATGIALPFVPNRCSGDDARGAIWLGPDEWLLFAPGGEAAALERAVCAARRDDPWLSLVDVSHNFTCLLLSGRCVRDVLAKGCALDLHPRVFASGDCAQTLLARTRVLLRALDDRAAIELCLRNSFARYAVQWLLDAAAEFVANPGY